MVDVNELRKKREAMEYAIRTVEMEGFVFTDRESLNYNSIRSIFHE